MTVETTHRPPDEDHFSGDRQTLLLAVENLLRPESVSKLNPYRNAMGSHERYSRFKAFTKSRGRRYAACSLENFHVSDRSREAVSRLEAFSENLPKLLMAGDSGLVLLGPPGTGKDHLLMGVMRNAIIDHGIDVRWYDGLEMFDEIKSRIADDSVSSFVRELSRVQVLAISDPIPPRDMLSTYELSKLRKIVDARYSNQMATWITTNVQTAVDARNLFTDAVLSRLLDGALEIFCDWESYRRPA